MPLLPRFMSRLLPISILVLACSACLPTQDDELSTAAEPVRVENAELGIAIAKLDPFFQVSSNEGSTIVLAPANTAVAGLLIVSADEPITAGGVNLVKAIEVHKADLEQRGGEFKGQRELQGPLGTAFYSRGHYVAEDGTPTEETVVFTVHPLGDRVLRLTYVYPQGEDSAQRVQNQLFSVFGELESVDSNPDSAADTANSADAGDAG